MEFQAPFLSADDTVVLRTAFADCVSAPIYPFRRTFEIAPLPAGQNYAEVRIDHLPGLTWRELFVVSEDTAQLDLGEDDRFEVIVSGEGADTVPRDASHLVVRTIARAYESVGRRMPGLRLEARNVIPHGRGLGSSGAAVVSGLLAAKGLLAGDVELGSETLLRLATELEGHPDNVAPALFGGLTIAWVDESGPQHKKLLVHRGVSPLVFVTNSSTGSVALTRPAVASGTETRFGATGSSLQAASAASAGIMSASDQRSARDANVCMCMCPWFE
jgi:hypothetical protein